MFGFFSNLPSKKYLIDDHTETLKYHVERIKLLWPRRHERGVRDWGSKETEIRKSLRYNLERAKFHKHMIEQISCLPDPSDIFGF